MNIVDGLIGLGIGLVAGSVLAVVTIAWGLKSARENGKIVFKDQDEVKDYLLIIGIRKEGLETSIIYRDRRVIAGSLKHGPLDFLKGLDLDLEKHR